MTRDEAKEIIALKSPGCPNYITADAWISTFVALGMLKLEEPQSGEDRFIEAMVKCGFYKSVGAQVVEVMKNAGLKVVKK